MAALDRIQTPGLSNLGVDTVKKLAAKAIWDWYADHKDDVLFKKGIGPFSLTIRVRDLTMLIERITGTPRPA